MRRAVRVDAFQWVAGIVCAVAGAVMLVAPHYFHIEAYAALRPALLWCGAAFVPGGWLRPVSAHSRRAHLALAGASLPRPGRS
jgi:hypothetical protein